MRRITSARAAVKHTPPASHSTPGRQRHRRPSTPTSAIAPAGARNTTRWPARLTAPANSRSRICSGSRACRSALDPDGEIDHPGNQAAQRRRFDERLDAGVHRAHPREGLAIGVQVHRAGEAEQYQRRKTHQRGGLVALQPWHERGDDHPHRGKTADERQPDPPLARRVTERHQQQDDADRHDERAAVHEPRQPPEMCELQEVVVREGNGREQVVDADGEQCSGGARSHDHERQPVQSDVHRKLYFFT